MKIRILGSALVGGVWHEPGIGNYSPDLANHLISLGVAEPFETKIVEEMELKLEGKRSSVSQPAQASRKRTARRSRKAN